MSDRVADVEVGEAMVAFEPVGSERRRLQTLASAGLAMALVGLSAVATWSAFATGAAARSSQRDGVLADSYSDARFWVAAEESLAREYLLDPAPAVRVAQLKAQAAVDEAMDDASAEGTSADRKLAATVIRQNAAYAGASRDLFDAADQGNVGAEVRIYHGEADPALATIEHEVDAASAGHSTTELAKGQQLVHLETVAGYVTSLAVGVGLLLIALFAWVRRRYSRENAQHARRNAHQATHDALTGLPNRFRFAEMLKLKLAAAASAGGSLGVVLLDLDRFKEVNDTLGHHIGDRLLQQIGPRIGPVLRSGEFMARLGGDEFALLIATRSTGDEALADQETVTRRILAALNVPFVIDDIALAIEASAGLARYPQDGDCGDILLQRADIAMYQAKTNHETLAVYDPTVDGYSPRKLTLLADLRQAVDRDELVVHYQPQVNMTTLRVVGVEALVRWQHPVEGRLSPGEFVPLAESSGFVHELTRYVLKVAVGDAKAWERAGRPLEVSVNISARCILDQGLPETVANTLAAAGLPAHWLKLEITESAMIADPGRAEVIINRLRHLGVALSIDDFGTGYTSLAYLRNLHVQELKIDQSFVMGMLTDRKDAVIVRTAVELAQRLGLESVAEGIEDAETLAALTALGCTTAQGYHLSRALPSHELVSWIDTWNSTHPLLAFRTRDTDWQDQDGLTPEHRDA